MGSHGGFDLNLLVLNSGFLGGEIWSKTIQILKQISEVTHPFSTIDQYVLSNSRNFSESRTHRIHGTYIYLKPNISDKLHVGKSTISMVWSPYLTFFFHNSTHDTQGSIVVELVAETVPNTLLAFTSRGADLTVRRNNGDAMAMVFVPKSDETKYLLAQYLSYTNPWRVRGKSPTKNKKTTQTRPYDPTKKNINPSIFWHIRI